MGVNMTNMLSNGKDDFYRQMFKLTIPIIIQNLLSAAVNSADVIMLNYVGQSAISAVSLAANYSNILFMDILWTWALAHLFYAHSILEKIIYRQFMQSRELHFVSQS